MVRGRGRGQPQELNAVRRQRGRRGEAAVVEAEVLPRPHVPDNEARRLAVAEIGEV